MLNVAELEKTFQHTLIIWWVFVWRLALLGLVTVAVLASGRYWHLWPPGHDVIEGYVSAAIALAGSVLAIRALLHRSYSGFRIALIPSPTEQPEAHRQGSPTRNIAAVVPPPFGT